MNKYTSNSSKGRVLEVDLEYPKEFQELNDGYSLALDKLQIKREILSEYQLKINDLCNIPIVNVKKWVLNVFDKEKYVIHYENLQLYLKLRLKLKAIHRVLEFIQSQSLKPYIKFNTQKRMEAGKNNDEDGKALYKLTNKDMYWKTTEKRDGKIELM